MISRLLLRSCMAYSSSSNASIGSQRIESTMYVSPCLDWSIFNVISLLLQMDQIPPPGPPSLFHIRISVIIFVLALIDLGLVTYSLDTILIEGVSAMVLFASEFMILLASISGTSARYLVGLVDLRRARGRVDAPSWEEKSMYLFYVDLAVGASLLVTSCR